ncbi:MAG: hypothetical protein R6V55_06560 [Desulfovermiculus sp.]
MKQSYEYKKSCLIFLTGLLIFSISGCLPSDSKDTTLRGQLIEAPNVLSTVTAAELDGITANADLQTLTGSALCDVTVVQINYQTIGVQAGEMTNASGVVLIPGGAGCPGSFPLVVYGRATNVYKSYALANPTNPETGG